MHYLQLDHQIRQTLCKSTGHCHTQDLIQPCLTLSSSCLHRSDSESEEEEEEEELPLLSDEEMNKLGAKLVKAEIMGNTVSQLLLMHFLNSSLFLRL